MKRFIDMGDQITSGVHTFAWWDTVTDRFEGFQGSETWETKEEFVEDFLQEYGKSNLVRYLHQFPDNWKPTT